WSSYVCSSDLTIVNLFFRKVLCLLIFTPNRTNTMHSHLFRACSRYFWQMSLLHLITTIILSPIKCFIGTLQYLSKRHRSIRLNMGSSHTNGDSDRVLLSRHFNLLDGSTNTLCHREHLRFRYIIE